MHDFYANVSLDEVAIGDGSKMNLYTLKTNVTTNTESFGSNGYFDSKDLRTDGYDLVHFLDISLSNELASLLKKKVNEYEDNYIKLVSAYDTSPYYRPVCPSIIDQEKLRLIFTGTQLDSLPLLLEDQSAIICNNEFLSAADTSL